MSILLDRVWNLSSACCLERVSRRLISFTVRTDEVRKFPVLSGEENADERPVFFPPAGSRDSGTERRT
jgi:hypothetical protein